MSVFVDLALLSRVFQIRYGASVGSSLYAEVDGVFGLVTAAHVIAGAVAGDKLAIRHKDEWAFIEIASIGRPPNGADICVIVPTTKWGDGIAEAELSCELIVGQDVVYCGFPLGIDTIGLDGDVFPMPLIKAAIFSGARNRDGVRQFLFDTLNNVGFSGGPIVARRRSDNSLHVVAIVSGYHFDKPLLLRRRQPDGSEIVYGDEYVRPNSGFMIGIPITFAVTALKEYAARATGS